MPDPLARLTMAAGWIGVVDGDGGRMPLSMVAIRSILATTTVPRRKVMARSNSHHGAARTRCCPAVNI